MILVAVEHGAQLLLSGVLEVAVELAVLDRVLVYGYMERIAGSAVAVRAEQCVLLRVGQIAIAIENGLHRIALAHAGTLVLLVVRCHVARKLYKVSCIYRTLYRIPTLLVALAHGGNEHIVRKRVLFRVRVFAVLVILVEDVLQHSVFRVKLVVLAVLVVLGVNIVVRQCLLDHAVPLDEIINRNTVLNCLGRVVLSGLSHILANIKRILRCVVCGITGCDQFAVERFLLHRRQVVVFQQHFADGRRRNLLVILVAVFLLGIRSGCLHGLNSRKYRLGIVDSVAILVLVPAHALPQLLEYLRLVCVQAVVIIVSPLLRSFERRLAEQHRLCPVARTLAVLRELQDLLAVLVQTVAAARIYGCRALKRLLYSTAAERQQQVRRRVGSALCRVKRNALTVVAVLVFLGQLIKLRNRRE